MFNAFERTFKAFERTFKTSERTFKTYERRFLLIVYTFSSNSIHNFPLFHQKIPLGMEAVSCYQECFFP